MLILLPILLISALWFYSTANRQGCKPWPWIGILVVGWWLTSIQIFPLIENLLERVVPSWFEPVLVVALVAADIGFIVFLRRYLVRRNAFKRPYNPDAAATTEPVYAPASKITCDRCRDTFPSALYLEQSASGEFLCERCRNHQRSAAQYT